MAKNNTYCDICLKYWHDEALFGEFISKSDIDVHYYCVLSFTDLPQRGESDGSGVYGFLVKDIKENIQKIKATECYLCGKNRAAVKCAHEKCEKTWHYICGHNAGCITQFIGQFISYCSRHVPETNLEKLPEKGVECLICNKWILDPHPAKVIFSSCCKEFSANPNHASQLFNHANCIQRYVVNAGYDSQCINCPMNSMTKKDWQNQMREKGIFVPQKIAVWENDEYFKLQVKNKCGDENCKFGRRGGPIYTCYACGCAPMHLKCAKVKRHEDYLCCKCLDQTFVNMLPR